MFFQKVINFSNQPSYWTIEFIFYLVWRPKIKIHLPVMKLIWYFCPFGTKKMIELNKFSLFKSVPAWGVSLFLLEFYIIVVSLSALFGISFSFWKLWVDYFTDTFPTLHLALYQLLDKILFLQYLDNYLW